MLILDTCALLWLASDNTKLSQKAKTAVKKAEVVFVSAISAWEIALKYNQKVLDLPLKPIDWFNKALDNHNLKLYPLDIEILTFSTELPLHHKDPADRFIIATAIKNNLTIITGDEKFLKYNVKVIF